MPSSVPGFVLDPAGLCRQDVSSGRLVFRG